MLKAIAINLPQFHPIPENDEWWGKSFTEWTNVTKAKPLFKGHYQPHLPADLGFYDLRLEEARIAQAELAKEYGIKGFCYYHYWFNGRRLLNRPLDDMLKTKTPDFPFMLCWANENWTRRWDGFDEEVLMKQTYSEKDDIDHINFIASQFFSDSRYITVEGKPFYLVYRPHLFPDIKRTLEIWRERAQKLGIGELYLGYVQSSNYKVNPNEIGFDCAIEFHPDFGNLAPRQKGTLKDQLLHTLRIKQSPFFKNDITSYPNYVSKMIAKGKSEQNVLPGITPSWDNSSRRSRGANILKDSSPQEYKRWLSSIANKYRDDNTFLFINAWNEWAEGNHLEPCRMWGRKYLEVTKEVLNA